MSEKKIDEQDLSKALNVLQDLAKGHSSRGTNTTAVESMSGEGGASQVHHTSSNSDPGGWAGSSARPVGENGAKDAVGEDGTDYTGGAEMVKSILNKLSKGMQLTAHELDILKGSMAPPFMKKDDDKDEDKDVKKSSDKDEDDDKDVKKSLADHASENETVQQGMEISDFLAEFVSTISKSLESAEARQEARYQRLVAAVQDASERNETFGKSLAGAFSTVSEALIAQGQRVDQIEGTPARGPKSNDVMSKSFDGPQGDSLSKSQISEALVEMATTGKISTTDVIRFDSTGDISKSVMDKVVAHRSGR